MQFILFDCIKAGIKSLTWLHHFLTLFSFIISEIWINGRRWPTNLLCRQAENHILIQFFAWRYIDRACSLIWCPSWNSMNLGRIFFGIRVGSSVYEHISVVWLTVGLAIPFRITPLIILVILSQFDWFNSWVDIVSLRSIAKLRDCAIGYNSLVLLNAQNYRLIMDTRQSICAFILLRLKLLLRDHEIIHTEDLTLFLAFYNDSILWTKNIINLQGHILTFEFLTYVVHLDWINDFWSLDSLSSGVLDDALSLVSRYVNNDGWRYNILHRFAKINLLQCLASRQLLHDGVIVDLSDL